VARWPEFVLSPVDPNEGLVRNRFSMPPAAQYEARLRVCGRLTVARRSVGCYPHFGPNSDIARLCHAGIGLLFDHLVGAGEKGGGDHEAKRLGGLEIDHQLECGRLFNGQVRWFSAFEDPVHEVGSPRE
jgi:hypothetical protein